MNLCKIQTVPGFAGNVTSSFFPIFSLMTRYRNDPKFSDRYAWANSADPDQTAPQTAPSSLIRVYTVCHSVCIVWTHYCIVEPYNSNFRVITTNFLGVRIFRKFTVNLENQNRFNPLTKEKKN